MSDKFEPIDKFKGKYFFLSNFYPSTIRVTAGEEFLFPTAEHCFQGMKVVASNWDITKTNNWLRAVTDAPTPAKAKYLGRSIDLNVEKWNRISFACMQRVQKLKYEQNPKLLEYLLATGSITLIEGTEWGDQL